jgi:hypothetical protein
MREFDTVFTSRKLRDLYVAYLLHGSDGTQTEGSIAKDLLIHSDNGDAERAYLTVRHHPGREMFPGAEAVVPKTMPWESESKKATDLERGLAFVEEVRKKAKKA